MKITIEIPETALALDVHTVCAAIRYIIAGFWPEASVKTIIPLR